MAMILDKNKFYQWDLERTLEIVDNIVTEVHFKKFTDNQLYVCEVYDNNGVRLVNIPNILFTTPEKFTAYFYCNDLFTKQHTSFDIIPRPKPTDYVYTETEVKRYDTLEQEIAELGNEIDKLSQKIDENQLVGQKTEQGGEIFNDYAGNTASAKFAHAEGEGNKATAQGAHAEGRFNTVEGKGSHAEGRDNTVSGSYSHAEGYGNKVTADRAHAEGSTTQANEYAAHAEGSTTQANGYASHAEGSTTQANGYTSHAEGYQTKASGGAAHSEGYNTEASGTASHSEGSGTKALGEASHASGVGTIASKFGQFVVGQYNEVEDDALFVVGNGISETSRSNAFAVDKNGNAKVQSSLRVGDVDVGSKLYESPYMKVDELPESGDMDKIYITPEGQYIYGLKDKDASTENVEIWDGSTCTRPKLVNGVYEITNGAELAYIVRNGGQEGAYYKLTKDIYLNDIEKVDWKTGVANNYMPNSWYTYYNNNGFYGSIDGNGHIIYGLYFKQNPSSYVPGAYGAGLIPFVVDGKTASITNLGVNYAYIHYEGAASAFIGDLKNNATATFSECFVGENVSIKGGSAGAFCGRTGSYAAVSLTNCYSLASAVVAYDEFTAGIAGVPRGNSTAITVNNSFNAKGAIFSSYYTTPRTANNSYQSAADTKSNEKVLTLDNMKGADVFTNPDKMPNLNTIPPAYIATENLPQLIVFACGWVKISTANKEYNPLLDLINYELMEDNTIKILGYKNGDNTSIVGEHIIPDYIDGYPVTSIGGLDHTGLTKITIPSTVKIIRNSAFFQSKLKEVVFNEGLETIENKAFYGCELEYVDLPNSIKEIDDDAFAGNPLISIKLGTKITKLPNLQYSNFTEFIIPDNITEFSGFAMCLNLTNVIIGKNIKTIPRNAFVYSNLKTITIPTSVITIGDDAFSTTSLTDIYYEGTEEQWNAINFGIDEQNKIANATIHFNQAPATKDYVETQLNAPKAEMILTDNQTGINYRVYITDGKLQMEVVQ